ncbi:hypothetical protein BC939DRAFT_479484 [Gamsiella multidivaricata]|uniref:uncharacterized protein n=1 Tax=Gamsiella multidivaricata TaxID=101098 RepID=UPI002220318F|nr:uncharacterized protein BC939DRAFT_479484 [Gamsiella multidivaricata]KAG0366846.1 hypothetical protein BGZ54_004785 [Gamsiella multidivaricata]KAI7819631.1 hypothetical protein BC939DRAFT_479484 [Gamsiella multidivaricata]
MRFTAAASLLAFAATVLADPWKNLGGDLAYIGPAYNATFKVGDTIPLEYTFYTVKMASGTAPINGTVSTNGTVSPPVNTGTATLTSLAWVGETGNKTLEVAFDNGRTGGLASSCLPTDACTGTYYPKRIDLVIPSGVYPSNYTIVLGYTLSLAGNRTLLYKQPVNIVAATANVTSPTATIANAPAVQVTLPVYAPKNSGLTTQVPKVIVGMTVLVASALLML